MKNALIKSVINRQTEYPAHKARAV
jgi:hypothetical protein